jgi:hypothetical protein
MTQRSKDYLMAKIFLGLTFIAALAACPSFAADRPNEALFEQCKSYQKSKVDRASMDGSDAVKATACISYMAGAFQTYNLATQCSMGKRTVDGFIEDYMYFTRKGGYLTQPQQVVAFMVLESCYCGKEPAAALNCPQQAK